MPGVRIVVAPPPAARGAAALIREHDAVVAQRLPLHAMIVAARSRKSVIYDMYTPMLLEELAQEGVEKRALPSSLVR